MTTAGREFVSRSYRGKYQPGTSHEWGSVVDIVGAKVRGDGAVSKATWFRVRCKHGYESVRSANELSRGVCPRECMRVEMLCLGCGTQDPARFNKRLKRRCMSCDRAFHRHGSYPCGKPKRATPAHVDVPNEHLCDLCKRWPGSKIPPAVRCDDCRRRRAKQRAEDLTEAEWRQLKLEATGPFNRNKAYGVTK